MKLLEHHSLLPYNTFGLDVQASQFAEVTTLAELREVIRQQPQPLFVLGGGSNIVFTHDVEGMVVKNAIRGIEIIEESENRVSVKAGAGERWHDFVLWAVAHDFGGVENLSLIPGTVGAAPIQNIGAYGVELKDVFLSLEAMDLLTGTIRVFDHTECRFGYRDSIFKHEEKGRWCITSVTFSLTRNIHHHNTSYGDIQRTLAQMHVVEPTIADVSRAVIAIRSSKLPDPAVIGNCGSFFKNPETDRSVLDRIQIHHPQAPHYDLPDGRVKIPAGWLIEQCGWKGKRVGNTGSYEKQALVLVNYGGATGEEVRNVAYAIIDSVEEIFGIRLEPEVNIL
jgi:UDP-N-acetylmuramate dehydrogenase